MMVEFKRFVEMLRLDKERCFVPESSVMWLYRKRVNEFIKRDGFLMDF